MEQVLKIKKLSDLAKMPVKASEGSAGYDLSAATDKDILLKAGESIFVPTGLSIELPSNKYAAFIFARSGLSCKHKIALTNSVGVIDGDYRGEVKVALTNFSDVDFVLKAGERIAQMVIMPVESPTLVFVDELGKTVRDNGGFGSSGRV